MDTDHFWGVIEAAQVSARESIPFHEVLTDLLAARTEQEILDYHDKFDEAHLALYRWDVWPAAYLIGDGCSDDSFMVLPPSLFEHPAAELSVDDSAQLGEDGRRPDHIA